MGSGAEIFNQVINQGGSPALLTNTLALRPTFGYTGRIFIASDTREIYRDTGTSWELIGSGGGSVNIYNSDGTLTGNRTVTMGAYNLLFSSNKNGTADLKISNTTIGNVSSAGITVTSTGGSFSFGKYSSATLPFKIILANDSFIYNDLIGDISILNNYATGKIKFSAGGASSAQMTLFASGRLGLNTTVDAGYLADINGNSIFRSDVRVQATNGVRVLGLSGDNNSGGWVYSAGGGGGDLFIAANIDFNNGIPNPGSRSSRLRLQGGGLSYGMNQTPGSASLNLGFTYFPASSSTGGNIVMYDNRQAIIPTSGNANFTVFRLQPDLNLTGTVSGAIVRGFSYSPLLTSLTGVDLHYCFESTVGRMEVANADTPNNIYAFAAARFLQTHNITAGQSVNGGTYYSAGANVSTLNLAGSATFGIGNVWAAGYNQNYFQFQAPGSTITVTQTALRTVAALTAFNQFGGANSGTITHCTGLNVLGFYNDNNSVITPVITNAYGIVINNLNNYSHNFTLTNRWGLYQDGSLDNNYLAGKLLVGTNTVTARQVHISGDVEYTTTLSGTSGGSSGQHLNVWVNGNPYKIKLENP